MSKIYEILKTINATPSKLRSYRKFIVEGVQVGLVRPEVSRELSKYPEVFEITPKQVDFKPDVDTYESRSVAMEGVLKQLKGRDRFSTLRKWRDECYEVKATYDSRPLLQMDRSSTCLFGVKNYGVTINGYVDHPRLGLCLWLQKRSAKQKWGGMWDTMVGGGISVGRGVLETAYKESAEEASLPPEFHRNLKSVGAVGCLYESEDGIFPNTGFVFDLPLPEEFEPQNRDGEVEKFALLPVMECVKIVEDGKFKKTVIVAIVDFFLRHGVIVPDGSPYYVEIVEMLHVELQKLYGD